MQKKRGGNGKQKSECKKSLHIFYQQQHHLQQRQPTIFLKRNSQPQAPPKKRKKIFSIITFSQGVDSSAHLAHFKTEEEYDNLLHFSPNGDDSDRAWVGLFNNVGTTCDTPAECQGLLQWTDGSSYNDASW